MTKRDLQRRIAQAIKARDAARAQAEDDFRRELLELRAEGYSVADIAAVLDVHRQRVYQLLDPKRYGKP